MERFFVNWGINIEVASKVNYFNDYNYFADYI